MIWVIYGRFTCSIIGPFIVAKMYYVTCMGTNKKPELVINKWLCGG